MISWLLKNTHVYLSTQRSRIFSPSSLHFIYFPHYYFHRWFRLRVSAVCPPGYMLPIKGVILSFRPIRSATNNGALTGSTILSLTTLLVASSPSMPPLPALRCHQSFVGLCHGTLNNAPTVLRNIDVLDISRRHISKVFLCCCCVSSIPDAAPTPTSYRSCCFVCSNLATAATATYFRY